MVEECVKRLKLLKIHNNCINAFKQGKVWESENYGALYELNEDEQKIVSDFENEHKGYKVYHVIHTFTTFGELYNLLYVGTEKEEWKQDIEDLKNGYAFSYVYNKTDNFMSEFGTIGIKSMFGGVIRNQ